MLLHPLLITNHIKDHLWIQCLINHRPLAKNTEQESMEVGLRESKLQWFVLKYFLLVLPSLLQLPVFSDAVKSLFRDILSLCLCHFR